MTIARITGGLSWLLAAMALYGSIAFQLEEATGRAILPIGRRNRSQLTIEGGEHPLDDIDHAPGVRKRF